MLRIQDGIQVDKFYPPADWKDNNNNWIDIRNGAENNTITLLYGVKSDYSSYSLFGLVAQVSSGTYDVYIDGVLVSSGVTSNTQYDIDFSNIATSYGTATTPETLTLHKIVIKPTTSSETITTFSCRNTAGTTNQVQCVLWLHFELSNIINVNGISSKLSTLVAITSKGDVWNTGLTNGSFSSMENLVYVPFTIATIYTGFLSNIKKLKRFRGNIERYSASYILGAFTDCFVLELIVLNAVEFARNCCTNIYKLKILPKLNLINDCNNLFQNASSLYPTKIDFSDRNTMSLCVIKSDSSHSATNFKGLKVSSSAPFGSNTSPQINISYAGLDRNALVELFNSLPTVTGSQTLNCVGATGTADLTEADKQIATDKGWALTLS